MKYQISEELAKATVSFLSELPIKKCLDLFNAWNNSEHIEQLADKDEESSERKPKESQDSD